MQNLYIEKQLIFLQEGSNRILSLQEFTTHQFTYFIYYLFQDKFKYPKIIKIQQVHQEIHAKQFLLFYLNCFLLATH